MNNKLIIFYIVICLIWCALLSVNIYTNMKVIKKRNEIIKRQIEIKKQGDEIKKQGDEILDNMNKIRELERSKND